MQNVFVVQYSQSDPWYAPAFERVFGTLEAAKDYVEKGHYSQFDIERGFVYTFEWIHDGNQWNCIDKSDPDYIETLSGFITEEKVRT